MKHLCVVHNNVDQRSSIGQLAAWAAETALEANLEVTVVARDIDPALRTSVTWRPLYVPPRIHAIQWAAARRTIVHALRGVSPDVLHVYQPQVAALADTWHVEFLSRPALEVSDPARGGWRARLGRAQQRAVAGMEDRYLGRLGSKPTVLFCSPTLEQSFARLYGTPRHRAVLPNPSFTPREEQAPTRAAARAAFALPERAFVVGFLGGADPRKGFADLAAAARTMPADVHLLAVGPSGETLADPILGERLHALGKLSDLTDFWAAIDVLAVPSRFEPFGMVVTEAAAMACPVVVSDAVGAAYLVSAHDAGEVAAPHELADRLNRVRQSPDAYRAGCAALTAKVSSTVLGRTLLAHWEAAWIRRREEGP